MNILIKRLLLAPRGQIALFDSFARANSTTTLGSTETGQAYTAHIGTWGVNTYQAYNVSDTDDAQATADARLVNGTFSVNAMSPNFSTYAPNLLFRYRDSSNCMRAYLYNGTVVLQKGSAGVFSTLTSTALTTTAGQTYALKVEAYDNSLLCYVDEALKLAYTLTAAELAEFTAPTYTRVGVRAGGGALGRVDIRFDNLTALA